MMGGTPSPKAFSPACLFRTSLKAEKRCRVHGLTLLIIKKKGSIVRIACDGFL